MNQKSRNESSKKRPGEPRVPVIVRFPKTVIERIDGDLNKRDVPLSRNHWLLEAAMEKLRRDEAAGGQNGAQ